MAFLSGDPRTLAQGALTPRGIFTAFFNPDDPVSAVNSQTRPEQAIDASGAWHPDVLAAADTVAEEFWESARGLLLHAVQEAGRGGQRVRTFECDLHGTDSSFDRMKANVVRTEDNQLELYFSVRLQRTGYLLYALVPIDTMQEIRNTGMEEKFKTLVDARIRATAEPHCVFKSIQSFPRRTGMTILLPLPKQT